MNRLLILILIVSVSCQSNDADYCDDHIPFLTTDFSNHMRSWAQECGSFEKVGGVDMEIYQKSQGDTLVQLTYSGVGNDSLYMISYWVPLSSIDSVYVRDFLSSYGATVYTRFSKDDQFGIYAYRKGELLMGRISKNHLIVSSPISSEEK